MMPSPEGILHRVRNSRILVIVIVFFSLLTDSLLLTLIDPILPDILVKLDPDWRNNTGPVTEDVNSNGRYGFLVAAKGAAQFLFNPFVGLIVTRYGYRRPMLVGDIVLMASTIAFAYGRNYAELFVTRLLQGLSSSVTAVTGMGLLASTYTDNSERGTVMGIAIGGLSLGIIVGPIYGSVLYEFFGREVPFLVLGAMVLFVIILQIVTMKSDKGTKNHSITSILSLMTDNYILIVAGCIFLLNLDVSVILAFLPMRLIELENPETWKLGIVVLPTSIGYLIAGLVCPRTTAFFPRWMCGGIGLLISSATLVGLTFSATFEFMLITTTFLGVALGMVSTSMQPIFAQLVDLRHSAIYGNVYAISDMAVCLAMFLGPLIGGPIVYKFGFNSLVYSAAILNISFCPFCLILRRIPNGQSEKETVYAKDTSGEFNSSSGFDEERTPLLSSNIEIPKSHVLQKDSRSMPTMDLSRAATPRYMDCLSGLEDIYSSEGESLHACPSSW